MWTMEKVDDNPVYFIIKNEHGELLGCINHEDSAKKIVEEHNKSIV